MQKLSFGRPLLLGLLLALLIVPLAGTGAQDADGVDAAALLHDSRSDLYRLPGGAVTFDTEITLRFRSATGDLDAVSVRVYDMTQQTQSILPMQVVATTADGYDLWETTLQAGDVGTILYYRFILQRGGETLFYEDDTFGADGSYNEFNKGGVGRLYTESVDASYQIAVYDPDFYTPEWFRNGIIYQIFPDRFRDGDPTNNPADGDEIFYGDYPLIFNDVWNAPMVDARVTLAPNGLGYWNSDFYGGDLAGIIEKLDYIADLGVTGLYLTPIFLARSNHRYDTVDFLEIDPMLGTLEDFRQLVAEAEARDIAIILDGVFNHMSSDSPKFDRYGRFPDSLGACESVDSEFRNWFYFREPRGNEPAPCDGDDGPLFYDAWFGIDTIPRINNEIFATRAYFIRGPDSVARTWGREGIGGWRLDVAGDIDDGRDPGNTYWESFRVVVRNANPEAVIIGEEWHDATPWLLGDEWDSTMNYRLRRALIGLMHQTTFSDNDGSIPALNPAAFAEVLAAIEEDYPPPAFFAMMNLLGSHDNSRIFWVMDNDVDRLKLVTLLQFALPGAPTIYYGDEIAIDAPSKWDGSTWQDDPYNRAPYPWPDTEGDYYPPPNEDVLAFYQTLGQMRHANPALREGEMLTLYTGTRDGLYAFLRLDAEAGNAALVVANTSDRPQTLELVTSGLLPDGLTLASTLGGESVSSGVMTLELEPFGGDVWTYSGSAADFAAPAAPASIEATGQAGSVDLSWAAVDGAAGYVIYASPVAAGGFVALAEVDDAEATAFTLTDVDNGFPMFYTVAAVGENSLVGPQSESARAVPSVPVDSVAYVDGFLAEQTLTLAYGVVVEVRAAITIDGVTGSGEVVPGILAQAALAADDEALDWQPMTYVAAEDAADVYSADLFPLRAGDYRLLARFSTDAGQTWTEAAAFADAPLLIVEPAEDTEAPPAPTGLTVVRASISGVELAWEPVEVDDLAAYRVTRTDQDGQTVILAELPPDTTGYLDRGVTQGNTYRYSVTAVDMSLNESEAARVSNIRVDRELLPVTFLVNVPDGTTGTLYMGGDFGGVDLPHWDPAGIVLEPVGDNQWAVTIEFPEGASMLYKFTRGDWDTVEKGRNCEEIDNRRLSVGLDSLGDRAADGTFVVEHTVAKWRDLDNCP